MAKEIEYNTSRTFTTNEKVYEKFVLLSAQKRRKVGHKLTELMLSYIRQIEPNFEI